LVSLFEQKLNVIPLDVSGWCAISMKEYSSAQHTCTCRCGQNGQVEMMEGDEKDGMEQERGGTVLTHVTQ
jgi:hypothetical protein